MIPVVIDREQLGDHPDAVLVDVRWYLDGSDGRAAYETGHLPGAVWVDLDGELAAHGAPPAAGRHPLPEPQDFATAMTRLGVGDHTPVIAYDDTGGLTAGRLVVMLRCLGHDAALLDGGLRTWDRELDAGWVEPIPADPLRSPRDRGRPSGSPLPTRWPTSPRPAALPGSSSTLGCTSGSRGRSR